MISITNIKNILDDPDFEISTDDLPSFGTIQDIITAVQVMKDRVNILDKAFYTGKLERPKRFSPGGTIDDLMAEIWDYKITENRLKELISVNYPEIDFEDFDDDHDLFNYLYKVDNYLNESVD